MLDQLGITKLRRGRDGNQESPYAANYDPAKANPYPHLPEVLETRDGERRSQPPSSGGKSDGRKSSNCWSVKSTVGSPRTCPAREVGGP